MKILALDLGDRWTGMALSDALGITAQPLITVETNTLENELETLLKKENITSVVVGLPKTMRGTESQQTQKTRTETERLKKLFPQQTWILWDERLTSKQAEALKKTRTKDDKKKSHSIAAAFILQSYLESLLL